MKKISVLFTSLLLSALLVLSGVTALADDLIAPTDSFFVADYANVIDEDDENHIIDKNAALCEATGAQIVVATVEFTGSTPIDDYCYKLFNKWGIGDKKKNNGVLLLLATGEEDYYVLAGTGLEKLLTGGVLGNMLDEYLEPDFATENYSDGAVKMFDALYDRVSAYYGFSPEQPSQPSALPEYTENVREERRTNRGSVIFIIIVAVILLIVISNLRRGIRRATGFYGVPFGLGFRPRRRGFFHTPPPPPPPGGFGFGAPPRRSGAPYGGGFSGGGGSSRGGGSTRGGFSGGSSHRSGFSGGGGSTRGGGAGRGRR